jgi:hypothetical protein
MKQSVLVGTATYLLRVRVFDHRCGNIRHRPEVINVDASGTDSLFTVHADDPAW